MAKRAMTIAVLAVSLVLMGWMAVEAQNISLCCWGNSDIHGAAILAGLGNAERNKPAYEVVLILQELQQRCFPPGGSQPQTETGVPHSPNASVSEAGAVDPKQVTKNGKFVADLVFTDDDLRTAIGGGLCSNNWIEGDLVASVLQTFGTVFECGGIGGADPNDPRGIDTGVPCRIEGQIGQQLCAPEGQPLFHPENEFDYIVKTICDDKKVACPDEPVEFLNEGCPIR